MQTPTAVKKKTQTGREAALDFIRGISVALMILAHAIFFFHDGTNFWLNALARTGNTVCFTVFLFVSGAALYYSHLAKPEVRPSARRLWERFAYIVIGFYLIAFMASVDLLPRLDLELISTKILKIIFLLDPPSFTEFLIPFILYTLSFFVLRHLYLISSRNLLVTFELGYLFYLLAYFIYPWLLPSPAREIKALFVGDEGLNRFPVFQYFPVLLLGMYWGQFLSQVRTRGKRDLQALILGMVFLGVVLVSTFLSTAYPLAILDPTLRWPPSVSFISIGLALAFFLYVFFENLAQVRWLQRPFRFIVYLGQDAFDLYIVHILILYFYKYIFGFTSPHLLIVLSGYLVVVFASVLVSSLNFATSPSVFRMGPLSFARQEKYRPKRRYLLGAVVFISLMLWSLNKDAHVSTVGGTIKSDEVVGVALRPLPLVTSKHVRDNAFVWYDSAYAYFRQVYVRDDDVLLPLEAGESVRLPLDHRALIDSGRADEDGSDLTIVYYGKDGYLPVPFQLENAGTSSAVITFSLNARIYASRYDNRYFLFYGNPEAGGNDTVLTPQPTEVSYRIELKEEHSPAILANLNRRWYLRYLPRGIEQQPLHLTAEVVDPEMWQEAEEPVSLATSQALPVYYRVEETSVEGEMQQVQGNTYEAYLDAGSMPVGSYTIYALVKSEDTVVKSQSYSFHVSEPIFVAWTMDWEGWDVPDSYLRAISAQSARHNNIPITHFFNPRIYLPSVMSEERAAYLTNWVKGRKVSFGDEIQLHMHMHFDLIDVIFNGFPEEEPVEEALAEADETEAVPDLPEEERFQPKTSPAWGFQGGGYDVYTTAYTYDEFSTMLVWADEQFELHGLETPTGYRAGGWFANTEILRALDGNGFLYDSSGRERNMWNGAVKSPWDLHADSQPYYPMTSDQNRAGSPQFNLLELPNNGGDCYAYTGEQMLEKFRVNYTGGVADAKKLVTFLSHAQWQDRDEAVMEKILPATDAQSYAADSGPIMYITLGQAYEIWK